MRTETHTTIDGKVRLYKRRRSRYWQCSTYMNGRNHRTSTKEESLRIAREFAEEWYMVLRLKYRRSKQSSLFAGLGEENIPVATVPQTKKAKVHTFREAARKFLSEYMVITQGQRNSQYAASHEMRLNVHLLPFFGEMDIRDINAGIVQEYRVHRHENPHKGRKPARSTLHHEIVTLRLTLKTAHRYDWISAVPDLSPPYKTSGKVAHRAWFSPEEYKALYTETRKQAKNPKDERYRKKYEDLHDYVLFMANTGLRPDEAARLEYRDVMIVKDEDTKEHILEIQVRGKRGIGYCKSMPGAVLPFRRIKKRHTAKPTDKIFGKTPTTLLNNIFHDLDLKHDRDGNVRTAYSLRHTYICFRLMEGADIYQVAKNCRTSVEMIEKFYAIHLKNTLDASAINVRKSR